MLSDGTKVVGELVGSDTYSDIAVVKIASDKVSTVAEFADSAKLLSEKQLLPLVARLELTTQTL